MDLNSCLIITSISGPGNRVLQQYATSCAEHGMDFILAGDVRSPAAFDLPGCHYLGIAEQEQLPFQLAKLLPYHNYARKNLAYLSAIKKGHSIIVETDDDNLPLPAFWEQRHSHVSGALANAGDWCNVYRYFSDDDLWPRGFSLHHIKMPVPDIQASADRLFCPVQQGLADENPDVDAMYRLSGKLPIYFKKKAPLVLGHHTVCPFNSQNTTWFSEAFPLLYLPSHCSFRMTDIWRSFVAQRILWTCDWHLSFHEATVWQERNEHNLLRDFEQEVPGYLNNEIIVNGLRDLNLAGGAGSIYDNLRICYTWLCEKKLVGAEELPLLDAWLNDLSRLM